MKASELIIELASTIAKYRDAEVTVECEEKLDYASIFEVKTDLDQYGRPMITLRVEDY